MYIITRRSLGSTNCIILQYFTLFFPLYFLPKLQVDLGEENHANEALRDIVTSEVHFKDEVLKGLQK